MITVSLGGSVNAHDEDRGGRGGVGAIRQAECWCTWSKGIGDVSGTTPLVMLVAVSAAGVVLCSWATLVRMVVAEW